MPADLRTRAIVLRRVNYGESDRILNLLTPEGKVAALARGVRKEKSRLAGSIELFSVSDIVLHQGRGNLATLTSAKMLHFYKNIMIDMARLELASTCLKRLDIAAEQVNIPEHFSLLEQTLAAIDQGMNLDLVLAWFNLNLYRAGGDELNLMVDVNGVELSPEQRYFWDGVEGALRMHESGNLGAPEIKLARFLVTNKLALASRINNLENLVLPVLDLSKMLHT